MKAPVLLVHTDFSPAADHALAYATRLAKPLGSRLVLLHVRRDSPLNPDALPGDDGFAHLSTADTGVALGSFAHGRPVPVVAEVGHGRLLPTITEAAARHQPLLIVLGRPNHDDLPDALNDSTALEILRHAPYPLLVVPPALARPAPPRRLLLAADGEPFALGSYADPVRHLLGALHAELTVLHCAPDAALAAATAATALASVEQAGLALGLPPARARQVEAADPAAGILAAALPADYDAVVLLARRRSVLGRLFHRGVTTKVLLHCPLPLLVLPVE
ncbi:hypothetical protein A0257_22975 (plasmid) [Hymenobacter psoromatis]|nr:hypothetical protein A0257_22975 [Hymenobacter psoromatis]